MEKWQEKYENATKRYGWKGRLTKRCRSIISNYENGEEITGDDDELLTWLVMRHPDAEYKTSSGISFFTVEENSYRSRGFWVHRIDGSKTDFSFYACITEPSHKSMVRDAMRDAINDQIVEFKMSHIPTGLICSITGAILTLGDAHVDHESPTFVELADEWALDQGGYETIILPPPSDGQFGSKLYDDDAEDWTEFHKDNATLRIVSRQVNLSTLRRKQ